MSHRSRLSQSISSPTITGSSPGEQLLADLAGLDEEARQPVLLLTPRWSEYVLVLTGLGWEDCCRVQEMEGRLVATVRAFIGVESVFFAVPVQHGDPELKPDGSSVQTFGMEKLGPGTWGLNPSVNIPELIHAFVILCEVPEPAPWKE